VRTYPIVCPSCRGLGTIDNPESVSSSAKITCPACKGNKTVIVSDDGNILLSFTEAVLSASSDWPSQEKIRPPETMLTPQQESWNKSLDAALIAHVGIVDELHDEIAELQSELSAKDTELADVKRLLDETEAWKEARANAKNVIDLSNELSALKSQGNLIERTAQTIAHRACCGGEHNPQEGKLHGYCVVCGLPWPCAYVGELPKSQGNVTVEGTDRLKR